MTHHHHNHNNNAFTLDRVSSERKQRSPHPSHVHAKDGSSVRIGFAHMTGSFPSAEYVSEPQPASALLEPSNHPDPAQESIGCLEYQIHHMFSSYRIPLTGEDFVYCPNTELFAALEEYCSSQTFHESKQPLVIVGGTGSGKSALFSNWIVKRQRQAQRSRNNEEFIFWHAVGCSRQSLSVVGLVKRLIKELKSRFELSRDLPTSDDRVLWELPRFLDLASKKGKVIVIVDGLSRLVSSDDSEAGLSWIPLELPANIRFILSTTSYDYDENANYSLLAGRYHRLEQEMNRRHWQIISVSPLTRDQRRAIIDAYIRKTVQTDIATLTVNPFITALTQEATVAPTLAETPGFLLFEQQIYTLLIHPAGDSPLFLRYILTNAHYAVKRGFSLWQIWSDWLESRNVSELFHRIFTTFERGFTSTPEQVEDDRQRSIAAGGLHALRLQYPWHPAFQSLQTATASSSMPHNGADTLMAIDLRNSLAPEDSSTGNGGKDGNGSMATGALSRSVLQNLGDQQWLAAAEEAEFKLEESR
jgi:hypothetical protein